MATPEALRRSARLAEKRQKRCSIAQEHGKVQQSDTSTDQWQRKRQKCEVEYKVGAQAETNAKLVPSHAIHSKLVKSTTKLMSQSGDGISRVDSELKPDLYERIIELRTFFCGVEDRTMIRLGNAAYHDKLIEMLTRVHREWKMRTDVLCP